MALAAEVGLKRRGLRNHCIGAIGIRSDGRMVHARNEAATSPIPRGHAEARLCKKLGKGAVMVLVTRYSFKENRLTMAKPCKGCQAILKGHKVAVIFFTKHDSSIGKMVLKNGSYVEVK